MAVRTRESQAGQKRDVVVPAADKSTAAKIAEVRRLQALVAAQPDIREDRVAALKMQIDNGTYNVPAEEIVESIENFVG